MCHRLLQYVVTRQSHLVWPKLQASRHPCQSNAFLVSVRRVLFLVVVKMVAFCVVKMVAFCSNGST